MKKLSPYTFVIIILLAFACKNEKITQVQETDHVIDPKEITLKNTSKSYISAWNENDTLLLQSITNKTFVRNVNGKVVSDNQHELFNSMQFWHTAMPDFKMVEKEITPFKNRMIVNWIVTGTNTGMFENIPPTGKIGHIEGISILTFNDDGHLVYETSFFNLLSLMEEWGYSLSPPVMK